MNVTLFLSIIGWAFAILSSIWLLLLLLGFWYYNHSRYGRFLQVGDALKGVRRTFPMAVPFIITLVSWALVFSL